MDINLVSEIVALTDERNYLRNLQEEADELNLDLDTVIMNRLDRIQETLETLEAE